MRLTRAGETRRESRTRRVLLPGRLAAAGAEVLAEAVRTPWNSLNSRLEAPGALQLTLFEELGDTEA